VRQASGLGLRLREASIDATLVLVSAWLGGRQTIYVLLPRASRETNFRAIAEPISLASGLLTLATFAFQSSITLYNTIQSFQNHPERVRSLATELEALQGVLRTLSDTLSTTTDVDISALSLPLLRCGKACEEFEEELKNAYRGRAVVGRAFGIGRS
jgi:hypothetical protein